MIVFAVIASIFVLQVVAVGLLKAYKDIPLKELKRRAVQGDRVAQTLFKVSSYGRASEYLLWGLVVLASAAQLLYTSAHVHWVLAYLIVALSLWICFVWLPASTSSKLAQRAAVLLSPVLSRILAGLYPIFKKLARVAVRPVRLHTGLYQKDDLLELIEKQKTQTDNRIMAEELAIVEHTLQFGEKLIRDYMTPKRVVDSVSSEDILSTHFLDDLHKKGHSRLPVYQDNPEHIVGVLYVHDLIGAKNSDTVKHLMKEEVYYVNEEKPLAHALQAFLKTQHHLFIVVNAFEEYVGIITIEDVLEQIVGKEIIDEFDQYDNLRAVAFLAAEKDRKARVQADPDVV